MDADDFITSNYNLRTGSRRDFARKLHDLDPSRSVKGWDMKLWRYDNKGSRKHIELPDRPDTANSWTPTGSYWYIEKTDTYLTFIRAANDVIEVPGETHRAMKEAYSNMVGKPATINEIAREFNFPRNWFDEYRRKHGWTHDTDPYTDEVLANADVGELVDDLLLRKRKHLHRDFERSKWSEIEADASKYRELEYILLNDFRNLLETWTPPEVQPFDIKKATSPYALVISPTDFHWGKYGWVDETGEGYNFETAKSRLMDKTAALMDKLPGKPDQIILAAGSDWFHVDNDFGSTTRGTYQDSCGTPAQILMTGCELAREHIELLRKIARVQVVFMPGNHDRHSSLALMMFLSAAYENVSDVKIEVSPKSRSYVKYGNSLIGFTHGDTGAVKKLPSLMATEKRELWGFCENHIWFHGHKHHQTVSENNGAMVIQLPSLAGHDRYHNREGFVMSRAGLSAHIIDWNDGLVGALFCPVRSGE